MRRTHRRCARGYYVSWVAPLGPDCGLDMIAHNDPGNDRPDIKVQVKRRADTKISREGLSAFIGTLGGNDVGSSCPARKGFPPSRGPRRIPTGPAEARHGSSSAGLPQRLLYLTYGGRQDPRRAAPGRRADAAL
jgi:Restriction endonuclease